MEDLPLGKIAALVPEFAVKDMPLGRTLMMIGIMKYLAGETVFILAKIFMSAHSLKGMLAENTRATNAES